MDRIGDVGDTPVRLRGQLPMNRGMIRRRNDGRNRSREQLPGPRRLADTVMPGRDGNR